MSGDACMPVSVTCPCGTSFEVEDEHTGETARCPECGADVALSQAPPQVVLGEDLEEIFDRDRFLLREKHSTISTEKHDVCDEDGETLVSVERPYHMARTVLAAAVGLAAGGVVAAACVWAALAVEGRWLAAALGVSAVAAGAFTVIVVAVPLLKKRHVTFYRDAGKDRPVLEILQDTKLQFMKATYTVRDAEGCVLALLCRNYVRSALRKRWECYAPDGDVLCIAKEDSIVLALLRRLLGPFCWLMNTSFIMELGRSGDVVGELNRKRTERNRYVLDLTGDRLLKIDRRVAVALGVMLDAD